MTASPSKRYSSHRNPQKKTTSGKRDMEKALLGGGLLIRLGKMEVEVE